MRKFVNLLLALVTIPFLSFAAGDIQAEAKEADKEVMLTLQALQSAARKGDAHAFKEFIPVEIMFGDCTPSGKEESFAVGDKGVVKNFVIDHAIVKPEKTLPIDTEDFPKQLRNKMRYFRGKNRLIFEGEMSEKERDELLRLSQDKSYRKAVLSLFKRSRAEIRESFLPNPFKTPEDIDANIISMKRLESGDWIIRVKFLGYLEIVSHPLLYQSSRKLLQVWDLKVGYEADKNMFNRWKKKAWDLFGQAEEEEVLKLKGICEMPGNFHKKVYKKFYSHLEKVTPERKDGFKVVTPAIEGKAIAVYNKLVDNFLKGAD